MPTYLIQSPDGRKFRVTGDGTKEEALAYVQSQHKEPPKIREIREQYPQYDKLSDGELASALHRKFYPQLDFKDFSNRIGYLKGANPAEYDPESAEFQEKYGPTKAQEIGRQLGLTARYVAEGGLGLAGTLANVPAALANSGLAATDRVAQRFGRGIDFRFKDQNRVISEGLTTLGLPQPESRREEVIGNLSRAVAGAGSGSALSFSDCGRSRSDVAVAPAGSGRFRR